jgi:hypothetical protein
MKAKVFLMLVISISMLGSGCATIKGYPERSGNLTAELQELNRYFDPKIIDQCNKAPNKTCRDEIVYGRILAIDLHFAKFQQDLVREDFMGRVASRWAVLGLTGAIATSPGASASAILGGISSGITGAWETIDQKTFIKETIPVLLAKMVALRKEALVNIMTGLKQDVEAYPLNQALIDVENYYRAGTITGALIGIAETAGAAAKKADEEIKKLTPLPKEKIEQKRALTKAIGTLKEANKADLEKIHKAIRMLKPEITPDASFDKAIQQLQDCVDEKASTSQGIEDVTKVFKDVGIIHDK